MNYFSRLSIALSALLFAAVTHGSAQTFTAGNLAVFIANGTTSNTTGSITELNTTTPLQPAVNTYAIDGATMPNAMRFSASATSTAYIANSNDGTLVSFTGGNTNNTAPNINTILPRAVGSLNNAYAFVLATTYTGASGQQTRCATTVDNTTWFIGDQSGFYSNLTTTPSPSGNIRSVKSFGGTVYSSSASSSTSVIQVNTLSAAVAGTLTPLPGLTNNSALQDFYLVSSGTNGTAFDILYILSATSNTAGSVAKYSLVSGTWVANGTYTTTFGGFGLAAETRTGGANLYVSSGLGALAANSLIKLNDQAGYNAAISIVTASNVTLFTAAAGTTIKGVAFAPALAVSVVASSQTNVSCNGGSNGAASVTATGGTGTLTYNWTPGNPAGDGTNSVSGLTPGTYTCTVTDAHTISSSVTFTITQPTAFSTTASQTNISCNGGSNGSATIAVTGGTGSYTYDWTPGNPTGDGTNTVTGLSASTYTVLVTDANSCTTTQTFSLTQPTALALVTSQSAALCNGGATGTANVTVTGGTGTYTYDWTPGNPAGDGTNAVSGLTAGTYSVLVTDGNGCTSTGTVSVTQPSAITVSVSSTTNVSCFGNNDGSATATASGGTGTLSYAWAPSGGNAATASSLIAGTYTVTVTDANGCTATATATITQPGSNLSVTASQTNVSCFGGTNGTASLNVSGGNPFGAGSKGLIISEFLANPPGSDSPFEFVEMIATKNIDFAVTPYTVIWCNNGTATSSGWITGGAISYAFQISTGTVTAGQVVYVGGSSMSTYGPSTNILRSINTGTANGDGGMGLPNSGGVMGNGGTNADGIGVFNVPLASITNSTVPVDAIFYGQAIGTALVSSGTLGYEMPVNDRYNGGKLQSTTFLAPDPGSGAYIVATGAYNVQTNTFPAQRTWAVSTTFTPASTVALAGLYTYSWSTTAITQNVTGLTAGSYTYTITDNSSCPFTGTVTITEPTVLAATVSAQTNVSCNGGTNGSATVNVTGGTTSYSYAWTPGGGNNATANSLAAGTYTNTITDANGCTITATVSITQPSALVASVSAQTNVTCNAGNNGSATVTVSGGTSGYTYLWSPSGGTNPSANSLVAGTYTNTITDANGCTITATVSITEPAPVPATATAGGPVTFCTGDSVILSANTGSGLTYQWQFNNAAITGATAQTYHATASGNYNVVVTTSNGCNAVSNTISVTVNALPSATVTAGGPVTFCQGGNVVLSVSGGNTYQWTRNSTNISGATNASYTPTTSGSYRVIVTNASGCTQTSAPVTVTVNPLPTSYILPNGPLSFCQGGDVTLSGPTGSGLTYQWLLNSAPISGATAVTYFTATSGIFNVTVTNSNGCSFTSSPSVVTVNPLPSATVTANSATAFCQGDSVLLDANTGSGLSYQWMLNGSPVSGATAASYAATVSGMFNVIVTNASGCSDTSAVLAVTVHPLPATPVISQSGNILSAPAGYVYQWYLNGNPISGATSQNYMAAVSGDYTVEVSDTNSCAAVSSPYTFTPTGISVTDVTVISATVFPNPLTIAGEISLALPETMDVRIEIYNVLGEQTAVKEEGTLAAGEHHISLGRSDFNAAGTYFIRIVCGNAIVTKKILVN